MTKKKIPSIARVFLTSMIVFTVVPTLFMGILLIANQVEDFRHGMQNLRTQAADSQMALLKEEVERTRDTEGRLVVRDLIDIAKGTGEGFYRYAWTEPGLTGKGFAKIGYVKLFQPFGWLIGTGAYVQDAEKDVQKEVLDRIANTRFGKGGYVFAGTYDGVSLTEPALGRNMLGLADANGVKIVQELISVAKAGGGFVRYVMPRLGGMRDAPKLSYAMPVPRWKWYIGAGMYVDDMETVIAARRSSLERSIRLHVMESVALLIGLLCLILLAARTARRRLQKSLSVFTCFFREAASGTARIDPDHVGFQELVALASTANDMVDSRLAAERELLASEERYRSIVENVSDAFIIHDTRRRILDVNENACRLYGYSREELIGGDLRLVTNEESPAWIEDISRRLLSERALVFETEAIRKDGTVIPIEVSARIVTLEGNGVIQSFVRDITARREAVKTMRESEALLRTLMDNMAAGVMIVDAQTHVVEKVNPATVELVGMPAGQIEGRCCHTFICPDEEHACPVTDLGQEVDRSDRVVFRADGGTIPVIKSVKRISLGGRDKLLETFIDITDRKRAAEERRKLEEQVRQTQKFESLGILAGGIAHDFNNILTTVLGNAELALMETALAYSGKASFLREPIDLRTLVAEMTDLLASSVSRKVVVRLRLEDGMPLVLADPSQVRQVVMNLLINASEAIGEGNGEIEVSAGAARYDEAYLRATELSEELPPGLYVRLEVADTGCGMSAETRARIFEPFYTTKFKGRGLGLAAVLGIVRSHKGALKVASEPGRGTRFTMLFPAHQPAGGSGPAGKGNGQSAESWSGTLLLVDDEESLRTVGSQMLARLGFSVLTASDGGEALEIYRRKSRDIDVVVLDLTMPRMDGAEALAEIRRIDPRARVILASGHSEEDVAGRFADQELSGILQKPYTMAKLRELMRGIFGG
jgi:two-component system cell cycle sensor histidine kinase/response regulator CckA